VIDALLAFELPWNPELRGILVLAVAVVVLPGSLYLLLATNLGARLGFLVTVAGLFGWMSLMGFVWTMYGIGYKGTAPHWKVEEVVVSEARGDLAAAKLEKAHDLSTWSKLPEGDPDRGDAEAAAAAAIAPPGGGESRVKVFETAAEFEVLDTFTTGGKKSSFVNDWLPGPHPPHYSVVQVQAVEGAADAPIYSVVLVRDLGKLRVPSFLIMCSSLIIFGITCNMLHRRDKALMAARAAATTA
jgi:hypothetical protein